MHFVSRDQTIIDYATRVSVSYCCCCCCWHCCSIPFWMNSSAVATFHFYFDAALYRCIEIFCEWCEFPPENFIVKQNNEKEKETKMKRVYFVPIGASKRLLLSFFFILRTWKIHNKQKFRRWWWWWWMYWCWLPIYLARTSFMHCML